jgi:hypothetical protein
MAASPFMLTSIQHGLEGTPGTLVPATYKHFGNGTLQFLDFPKLSGFEYAQGIAGGVIENTHIADAGSRLTLTDTVFSPEAAIWLFNMGIKASITSATADNSHTFAFPTTAANTISNFTWEMATKVQEWEFGYGTCTNFNIHGDVGADNGSIMYNAIIDGRVSATSTATGSLTTLTSLHPLNINYASIHFDALGTAAGSASATPNILRAFSIDVVTGWELRRYADGRSTKDGSIAVYKNYEISGELTFDLDTASLTRISNARAGTSEIVAIKMNGASSRLVNFKIPLSWGEIGAVNENNDGVITVTMPIRGGYSTTSTAQGPSVIVVPSADTTVT